MEWEMKVCVYEKTTEESINVDKLRRCNKDIIKSNPFNPSPTP